MKFDTIASETSIQRTVSHLEKKGYAVSVVDTRADALAKIKEIIPQGATVMNGSSVTLEQIGYMDYLKADTHGWTDLHAGITGENDPVKRAELRKKAAFADFYVGSVNALAETGEFVIGSNTGSQMPHITFTSPNLIFVVGAQKIVPSVDDALRRLQEYVVPLEDDHMHQLYNTGTALNKILIFRGDAPFLKRSVRVILVNEKLGF